MSYPPLPVSKQRYIRELRYEQGWSLVDTAREVGCSTATVFRYAPGNIGRNGPGKVDPLPLQKAFVRSGLTPSELGRRLGWVDARRGRVDTSRVQRALALREYHDAQGCRMVQRLTVHVALQVAEALDLDPHEVGL